MKQVNQLLSLTLVVRPLDPNKTFKLYTTTSNNSLLVVLAQVWGGRDCHVLYLSKKLGGSEKGYTDYEKICLFMVITDKKLWHYLSMNKVVFYTHKEALKLMLNLMEPPPHLAS